MAACTFDTSVDVRNGATENDASLVDGAGGDSVAASKCEDWNPQHFAPCDLPAPTLELRITAAGSPWTFNTVSGKLTDKDSAETEPPSLVVTQSGGVALLVISATNVVVETNANLRVLGSRPLLIAAFAAIDVSGTIDVSSDKDGDPGAGSDPDACSGNGSTAGEDGQGGTGGGGGGGFRGNGGPGGDGDSNGTLRAGGMAGTALPNSPLIVRGGCSGADSGVGRAQPSDATPVGAGGQGGGAIHLSTAGSIMVNGTIHAGGAGGKAGIFDASCGGGGGGSGGYIGLEAASVDTTAGTLAANGGGAGEGGQGSAEGDDGQDGLSSVSPASGGDQPAVCGSPGGIGSAAGTFDGGSPGPLDSCGGGGGGGGAGFVLIHSADYTTGPTTISPPAQVTSPPL